MVERGRDKTEHDQLKIMYGEFQVLGVTNPLMSSSSTQNSVHD